MFVARVFTPSVQGYFLLFESMLDTVIFARDKWLKDQARGIYILLQENLSTHD